MNRVFITGMGAFSSLGNDVQSMWDGLVEGRSGVKIMNDWRYYNGLHCHLGAPRQIMT